jgi:hypothetical protein
MNFKTILQIGVAVFTATSVYAGQYQDYQIQYLQEASVEETGEKDKKAGNYFAALAAKSTEENRPVELADLPRHWQSAAQRGRTPKYRARLLELEGVVDAMSMVQREANAEFAARLQVCLFHARHEMSESLWDKIDTAKYMECAEAANAQIVLVEPPASDSESVSELPISNVIADVIGINGLDGDLPPANPGECYARVYTTAVQENKDYQVLKKPASSRVEIIPAVYETIEVRRLVKEASSMITEVPAVYESVAETILIKEASTRITEVPATYKTVEERVLLKEASTRLEEVPAVYEWVEERVIDTPAHTAWKEGGKIVEKIDGTSGQAICLVEVPATYKTLRKRILQSAANTQTIAVPAEYKTVTKRVLDKPATTKVTNIPAEYETFNKRILKTPAKTKVTAVPAEYTVDKVKKLVTQATTRTIATEPEYETVTKTSIVTPSRVEWRQVLCDVNLTRNRISGIQDALMSANYNPGASRGELNAETMDAVTRFQQDNQLATGGITYESVRLLEK